MKSPHPVTQLTGNNRPSLRQAHRLETPARSPWLTSTATSQAKTPQEVGPTAAEAETHQEAGTHQEAEVGTIGETKTHQEARTTAAEAARTQQLSQRVSLELRRKMRLEISRTQPSLEIPQELTRH